MGLSPTSSRLHGSTLESQCSSPSPAFTVDSSLTRPAAQIFDSSQSSDLNVRSPKHHYFSKQYCNSPRHKTNTCRKKILGNYFLREYIRGLYSHSREYRKIFSMRYFPSIFRGIHSVGIHAAPVFAPARIQENIPGELFMYWFRARGYISKFRGCCFAHLPEVKNACVLSCMTCLKLDKN